MRLPEYPRGPETAQMQLRVRAPLDLQRYGSTKDQGIPSVAGQGFLRRNDRDLRVEACRRAAVAVEHNRLQFARRRDNGLRHFVSARVTGRYDNR